MMENIIQNLWVEKYRPTKVSGCVLPERILKEAKSFLKDGSIPNLILSGSPGTGKTSLALAIINELNATYIFINGSDESGIDVFRTKIKDFSTTKSLLGGQKIVLIDEADHLNQSSTQPALRSFSEQYSENVRFIFTVNHPSRIIDALHSRFHEIKFGLSQQEKQVVAEQSLKRIVAILDNEKITYTPKAVAAFVARKFPDLRGMIMDLEVYSKAHGLIDEGILVVKKKEEIYEVVKSKGHTELEDWVLGNYTEDAETIYSTMYSTLKKYVADDLALQSLIKILGKFQMHHHMAADKYIHVLACLVEIKGKALLK
jgi:DNA polymerase III delta prime subunit